MRKKRLITVLVKKISYLVKSTFLLEVEMCAHPFARASRRLRADRAGRALHRRCRAAARCGCHAIALALSPAWCAMTLATRSGRRKREGRGESCAEIRARVAKAKTCPSRRNPRDARRAALRSARGCVPFYSSQVAMERRMEMVLVLRVTAPFTQLGAKPCSRFAPSSPSARQAAPSA